MKALARTLIMAGVLGVALFGSAQAALASPTVPHDPKVPAGIGPGRVIVLRPHRADLIDNRAIVRVVPLPGGAVRLETVIRAIGDGRWANYADGTATLFAGLMQRPQTTLHVGAPVTTLRLVDSATSPAYLTGSGASVDFTGVTVISAGDTGSAGESAHRPYVSYVHSTVSASGATFDALGSRSVPGSTGVTVGSGSVLTVADSTFRNSGVGLVVDGAAHATLSKVTATGNGAAGVDLDHTPVTIDGLSATGNATGLQLRATVPTSMQAITLSHNATGLSVTDMADAAPGTGSMIGPLATDHNSVAGVALVHCPGCRLRDLTSSADRAGVRVGSQSAGATVHGGTFADNVTAVDVAASRSGIEDLRITGSSAVGIAIEAAAAGVQVSGGTVTGGPVGIAVNGSGATVVGTTIDGAATGVQLGGSAADIAINQVATSATGTGLAIDSDAGAVTVTGFSATQSGGTGIRSGAAHVTLVNPTITGARVGLDLKGGVTVTGAVVSDCGEAVRVGAGGRVHMTDVQLSAHVLGLRVDSSAKVSLVRSRVDAPLGARGHVTIGDGTSFPALPLRWLGALALIALTAAAFLETLRRLRERGHDRSFTAPAHVLNIA